MPLDKDDIDRLDERYVKKDDCGATQQQNTERIAVESTRAAVMESQLATIIKLLWLIAGAYVGGIVAAILAMILR